jgi:acyl-coenzyme A thioesterase PaaI-like protein
MRPAPDGTVPAHQPHCLGCGPENPAGMGLRLRVEDERVTGTVRFDQRQEGAPGFAHGGAVATVLDDALGTVLILVERPAVTASLTVDFRAPAFLDRELVVEAWCERVEGRKLHLAGQLREGQTVLAEARALFVAVDIEHFRRGGQELPERWDTWGREASAGG